MGNGRSDIGSSFDFCFFWIMVKRKKDLIIIGITIILYIVNQVIKAKISIELIRWFLLCYFNDTIGGITFTAYCNIVFSIYNRKMVRLWQIELLLFIAGLFWKYVTLVFRTYTVSDAWDIVAYMMGGLIYWLITRKEQYGNK